MIGTQSRDEDVRKRPDIVLYALPKVECRDRMIG